MSNGGRSAYLWGIALVALAMLPAWASTVGHRTFTFPVRFQSDTDQGKTVDLERGMLLDAAVRDSSGLESQKIAYQPIVLCENLTVTFDNGGISQWVALRGFCPAPGEPIAPEQADLKMTDKYFSVIRDKGCDENTMLTVRNKFANTPPQMSTASSPASSKWQAICRLENREACVQYFAGLDEIKKRQVSIDDLLNDGRCGISVDKMGGRRVWVLTCP